MCPWIILMFKRFIKPFGYDTHKQQQQEDIAKKIFCLIAKVHHLFNLNGVSNLEILGVVYIFAHVKDWSIVCPNKMKVTLES